MALPVGFISTNKINAGKNFKQSSTAISEVRIETIGDPDKRSFTFNGAATPTSPIELIAKQNYNIIKYPGLNDQQAQSLGLEYEPIVLSGKIDIQDLQRGISKLKYENGGFAFEWSQTEKKHLIDEFFEQLKIVQDKSYQIKLIASVFDPAAIYNDKYFKENALPDQVDVITIGETTTDIRCVISEIRYSCHLYGVWDYSIILIPISPSNQKFKKTDVTQKKTSLNNLLKFVNDTNNAIETVNDVLDTANYYYDAYVHNSLAALSQELNKFERIGNNVSNTFNIPANAVNQVLNVCYGAKTWAEDFCRDSQSIKSRYTSIKNVKNWQWNGPVAASSSDPVLNNLESQVELMKSNINFGNTFEDSLNKTLESRLFNTKDQLNYKFEEINQELNKFEARYEQKILDKQIRQTIIPLLMIVKKFIQENEVKSPYTLYVTKQSDSLRSIANKSYNDVTKWREIADFNNLDGDELIAGQQIKIPVL